VHKTIHITVDDEDYRRRMGRGLNKSEASIRFPGFSVLGRKDICGPTNWWSAPYLQVRIRAPSCGGRVGHGAHLASG